MSEEIKAVWLTLLITGVAILAYRHPEQYRRLAPYIACASVLVGLSMFLWLLAVQNAELAITPLLEDARDYARASQAVAPLKPNIWLILAFLIGGPAVSALLVWVGGLKKP